MENIQSNPMSEYDFAEIRDDVSQEEQEKELHSIAVQRMDPNLMMILKTFQLEKEVIERFAASGLKFTQLAGLSNEDLAMLGVVDRGMQEDMLMEFANLEGQAPFLEQQLRNFQDLNKASCQEMSVIDLIQNQLISMNTLIAATIMKVGAAQSAQSPGVVLNNTFNPPELVLGMLDKLTAHTSQMTELIQQLKSQQVMELKKDELDKQAMKQLAVKSLLLASGVIIGFFIAKQIRAGKKFF